jgi:tetratricopeptide (TPR) repeat protein
MQGPAAHDPALQRELRDLCSMGHWLVDKRQWTRALDCYQQALALLPEPRAALPLAYGIQLAIGDIGFLSGDFAAALRELTAAQAHPRAEGDPFLLLRLGQCRYELGETGRAGDDLARALDLAGTSFFEEEDEKYLDFAKALLPTPPGGWDDYQGKPEEAQPGQR